MTVPHASVATVPSARAVIGTVWAHQALTSRRQRVRLIGWSTLLTVTAMAGILGWSSHHTIVRVFDQAVQLQAAAGNPAPANPFLLKPSLSLLSNMVVYIPLIGALIALLVGHLALAEDQTNGMGRLIFTRPIARTHYALGKMLSVGQLLATVLAGCWALSLVALLVVNRTVSGPDLARLAGFYALSWAYLSVFALIGMLTALLIRRRSLALLSAIAVWIVVTFVLPQFVSGLRPTQSLSPISEPAGLSQAFFRVTNSAQPLSLVEGYKDAAGSILRTTPATPAAETAITVVPILIAAAILALLVLWRIHRHDYSRSASDE
ncbi:MAG: ABC transporter permease [Mycobacterium sp.]